MRYYDRKGHSYEVVSEVSGILVIAVCDLRRARQIAELTLDWLNWYQLRETLQPEESVNHENRNNRY